MAEVTTTFTASSLSPMMNRPSATAKTASSPSIWVLVSVTPSKSSVDVDVPLSFTNVSMKVCAASSSLESATSAGVLLRSDSVETTPTWEPSQGLMSAS